MDIQTKLEALAQKINKETCNRLVKEVYVIHPELATKESTVMIKPGKKYTKIDVGSSGKYMVDNKTGDIYGIKGYGQIHRGHHFGTLDTIDQYYWGDYTAMKISSPSADLPEEERS